MTDSIHVVLYLVGTTTFFIAALLSFRNYWSTRGLTNYWLFVSVAAFTGTTWAGSMTLAEAFGLVSPFLQELHVSLAAMTLAGYAVSFVKATTSDIVTEVI